MHLQIDTNMKQNWFFVLFCSKVKSIFPTSNEHIREKRKKMERKKSETLFDWMHFYKRKNV